MGYRENWFNNNPGIKLPHKRGVYYKCVHCGGLFLKSEIDIDHRIPKRKGGTDDLWNLQPMCIHCNRSKNKNQSLLETAESMIRAGEKGDLGVAIGGMAKQKLIDILNLK